MFLESAGPPRRDRRRPRGRRRPHPDPRRDRPEPARHAESTSPAAAATRAASAASGAGASSRSSSCSAPAPASTSASTPSRRCWHRALPELARDRFEREDMAFVSYHMGMGNLESVLRAYGADAAPYTQVYFDSTPVRHAAAYGGSPRSATTPRTTGGSSARRADHGAEPRGRGQARPAGGAADRQGVGRGGAAPAGSTPRFTTPASCGRPGTTADRRVPGGRARDRAARDRRMGELAERIDQRRLYRGLRPEALATALYIGAQVRALSAASRR